MNIKLICCKQVPKFSKGDRVQVNRDLTRVMTLQENSRNGWLDGMEQVGTSSR